MENKDNKPLWKIVLRIATIPIIVTLVSVVFITVAVVGDFDWDVVKEVYQAHWILFASVIALVSGLVALFVKFPKRAPVTGLVVLAFILILASAKDNQITEKIREHINDIFEIDLLLGAITIMALALALATIGKKEQT